MAEISILLLASSEDDGGLARVARTLAEGLPEHGIRVAAVLQQAGRIGSALTEKGIPVHIVPELLHTITRAGAGRRSVKAAVRNLGSLPRVVEKLRELAALHDATIFYGHGNWPNHLAAEATRGSEDLGAVWHVHNAYSGISHLASSVMLHRGDVRAIIAVSHASAAPFLKTGARVEVVHNGVPLDVRRPDRGLRERLGIDPDAFLAGYIGRLVPHKGIDVLVESSIRLLSDVPKAHLVVMGGNPANGDFIQEIRARFDAKSLGARVHLLGYVDIAAELLCDLDVSVVPSIYADPCPLSVLESLAGGVPVIGSRIGGIPELIDDGHTGILVQPGDANALAGEMIHLAANPERRRKMALAARESAVRRFDQAEMIACVAAILKSVSVRASEAVSV